MTATRKRSVRSTQAEANFRARVEELGGEVLEPNWLGARYCHRVRCVQGHLATPRPTDVQKGKGLCRTCAGNDPRATEAAFRQRVTELGGEVLEPMWLGKHHGHRVRCAAGHLAAPRPNHVQQGGGLCRTCARNDPKAAEEAFRSRVDELGGVVLETTWLGKNKGHRVRCAQGHESTPRPSHVQQGKGICRVCAGRDPRAAEAAFQARVKKLGGIVLEPVWLGAGEGHRVRCAQGHESAARPSDVQQGRGLCRTCAGKAWDVFYVVADDLNDVVKFGITSGDPRPRLRHHARDGFDHVIRLVEGLPGDVAPRLERTVLAALRDARESPVRGAEYFPVRTLALILALTDGWTASSVPKPSPAGAPRQDPRREHAPR
ncbi:hypothetical protein GCM10010274_46610 [Streptomyces lavendofoliae]|uniref:Uncharacterized protein n=1 Tax=Streptomyces lavendofoliae TaxID=67314 RepID=A0A918I0Y9_9ACTN|nr:hypothetical protein GCM10010274_46610 [Streptomyces lavendofoliae]